MKKILLLGASRYYAKNLTLLADAGFEVHALDRNPDAYGAKMAHHFAPVDICNPEAVLNYARQASVDGVMAVNEFGVRSAAYVAQQLGLVGIHPESAHRFSDKGAMREAWQEAGLAQPRFRIVSQRAEIAEAIADLGLPCVLKPTECGGGGRGISIIRTEADIEWAYEFAAPYAKNRFIVESFMDGTELTVETLTINSHTRLLGVSDKTKPALRTRVATSLNYWAAIPDTTLHAVEKLVTEALMTLGLRNGMGHTEVIVTAQGPQLVEASPRGGGGHVFHTLIQAVSGINAPVELARLLTGLPVNLPDIQHRGGVYRFFNPSDGILKAVHHLEQAAALPGVLDIGLIKAVGERVGYLENSLERAGYVVTSATDRAGAIAVADAVEKRLVFEVEPNDDTVLSI